MFISVHGRPGRYLKSGGKWCVLRQDARKFLTILEAKSGCIQEQLENVEIVVVRDELLCMRVPLNEDTQPNSEITSSDVHT